ncbi:malto-oligosyltrehalose trehalohydrolase [Stieleria varia]|uniref:Malto-oligosyltrehalose trehalohydrolase n=1 Tax=Stieleria varia TaxID=2528005 RepID=A0A5C6AM84_9BACT|nr:malto-oligosyltrehalose trehalohydrolase [Stieleria varia]TWU01173.1 Malto-oligosyltrehalose trehalohydrolase [Stieleria varia]
MKNQLCEPGFDPADVDTTHLHQSLGAVPVDDDQVFFSVFAPTKQRIDVQCLIGEESSDRPWHRLKRRASGFHTGVISGLGDRLPGSPIRYFYSVDSGPPRPDPASRFQPEGVHGPSEVVDTAFSWTDDEWQGVSREDLVIYELHIGAFTESGTFVSAIDRLDELVELGITAIELMPVAASAGRWNWGYDGVAFFAPSAAYGTPDDFRRLVDAAHQRGLAVLLDVVYNHLGPEGNYLGDFGPYLSDKHQTPWGAAPNFDAEHSETIRRFFVANAIAWLAEYHLDGLRVDAIHCMADDSDTHIVSQLSDAVAMWSTQSGRSAMLIAESNVYDPEMLTPRQSGGLGFDAQWCDDFLHSVFAVLRPGEQLSNRVYRPHHDLSQALRVGYVYEGTLRRERWRPNVERRVETAGLIYSIQNHDFIGNHPLGQRLHQLTSDAAHRAAAALLILSPAIPMLFMGEEFACDHPFCFFVDFSDENMRQAVVDGRRKEYPQHDWSAGILPIDPNAFQSAKIGSASAGNPVTRDWYRTLIGIRKAWRASGLLHDDHLTVSVDESRGLYAMHYERDGERGSVVTRLNSQTDAGPVSMDGEIPGDAIVLGHSVQPDGNSGPQDGLRDLHSNHAAIFHHKI